MIIKAIIWPKLKKKKKKNTEIKPWMFDYIDNQYLINDSELYSLTHETIKKLVIKNQPVVYNHNKNEKVGNILYIYTSDNKLIAVMKIENKKYIELIKKNKIKHVSPSIMYYKSDTKGENPYLKEISLCEYPYFKDNKIIEIIASEKKKNINDNLYSISIMTELEQINIFDKKETLKKSEDENLFKENNEINKKESENTKQTNNFQKDEEEKKEIQRTNKKRKIEDDNEDEEYKTKKIKKTNSNIEKEREVIQMLNEKNKMLQNEIREYKSAVDDLKKKNDEKDSLFFLNEYKKFLPEEIPKEDEDDIRDLYIKDKKNGKQGEVLLKIAKLFNKRNHEMNTNEEVYLKANDPVRSRREYYGYKKPVENISDMVGTNAWNNQSQTHNDNKELKGKNNKKDIKRMFNIKWLN